MAVMSVSDLTLEMSPETTWTFTMDSLNAVAYAAGKAFYIPMHGMQKVLPVTHIDHLYRTWFREMTK